MNDVGGTLDVLGGETPILGQPASGQTAGLIEKFAPLSQRALHREGLLYQDRLAHLIPTK